MKKVPTNKMSASASVVASSLVAVGVKTHANPIRLVLFSPICQYCRKPASHYANCYYQCAALACDNQQHIEWANRDANHWLHILNKVRPEAYKNHKLFTVTGLLEKPITVKRSSGAIDDDWKILKPFFGEDALIQKDSDKGWCIPVMKKGPTPDKDIKKDILVEDLKNSLPVEQKGLVDEFIDSLNSGFYLKDAEAHDAAVSLALANDDTSTEEESSPVPLGYRIENVYHAEYGFGRVCHPN